MGRWQCTQCGYVYASEDGDPLNGVFPGTELDEIPDGWICPQCGAEIDQFTRIE